MNEKDYNLKCQEVIELKQQIEKLKCCGNCKYFTYIYSEGVYVCKRNSAADSIPNRMDKCRFWELND